MTFYQMLDKAEQQGIQLYPDNIPEALQETIADWFGNRHIADDVLFPLWFKRLLNRDFTRYEELLRIEPGIAQYDYLVGVYRERRRDAERTPDLVVSKADVNRTTTKSKEVDFTRTVTHSGIDSTDDDLTITHPTKTDKVSHAVDASRENYGGSTQADLRKDNPMSVSYQNGLIFDAVTGGDGTGTNIEPTDNPLDWSNPTSQAQSGIISRTTDKSKALPADNYDESVTSYTGTDKTERDISVTHGHVVTTRDLGSSLNNKETTAYAGSVDTSTTGTDKTVTYDRYTGRDETPADILKRAAGFIMSTSAWEWLYKRLDTCFISVYDY